MQKIWFFHYFCFRDIVDLNLISEEYFDPYLRNQIFRDLCKIAAINMNLFYRPNSEKK